MAPDRLHPFEAVAGKKSIESAVAAILDNSHLRPVLEDLGAVDEWSRFPDEYKKRVAFNGNGSERLIEIKNVLLSSLHSPVDPEIPEADYPAVSAPAADGAGVRLIQKVPRSKLWDSYMPNHLPILVGSNVLVYLTKERQKYLGVEEWASEYEPLLARVRSVVEPGVYECRWLVASSRDADDIDGECDGYACRWSVWSPGPPDDNPFNLLEGDFLAKNFLLAKDGSLFTALQKEMKRLINDRYIRFGDSLIIAVIANE